MTATITETRLTLREGETVTDFIARIIAASGAPTPAVKEMLWSMLRPATPRVVVRERGAA